MGYTSISNNEKKISLLSVQDSGPGIPTENQGRIFEPFYQLDDFIRRKHGGSGLGLTISKRTRGAAWWGNAV